KVFLFMIWSRTYSYYVPVSCKPMNISSKYQHCRIHPDGVHDLDCFGRPNSNKLKCVWKPGNQTTEKTYRLVLQQQNKSYCKAYSSTRLTEISKLPVFTESAMTAEVFQNGESQNCTKAVFKGLPKDLMRCGPPYSVSFSRHSGRLVVNVSWEKEDTVFIKNFSVRYKALGSPLWSQSPVQSQNKKNCTVENLNSSLVYSVQIQCTTNDKCSQCVRSKAYTVPSELTTRPVLVSLDDSDIAKRKGSRLVSLTWKFPDEKLHDGYYVTIGKMSGEDPREQIFTTRPEIRLILSYSAYHLNINAVNNASTSPTESQIIPQREDELSMGAGKFNVTVHSNTSFTIYWNDNLIMNYVCYSVEWMKKGHKAVYMSFYQNECNHRTLTSIPEPLEPYERYSITLHVRPNKDTCNMKFVNNSESTYGSAQFYFIQGSPVSAPTNISSYNVTLDSVVLEWSSIPEEDLRGFLMGYIIHYTEYKHRETSTEKNITVDPASNSYELGDLKSSTMYTVQISGFTETGAGVRSAELLFKTNYEGWSSNLSDLIIPLAVMTMMLIFGPPIIKRAKVILWPSIPNPGDSNAMQKIDGPCEQKLVETINTLTVEEWYTSGLQIVEKEDVISARTLVSVLPLLHASEDEEDLLEMTCDWIQRDTEEPARGVLPYVTSETCGQRTDHQAPPFAFMGDYTTMEMFQQATPQGVPANTSGIRGTESEPEDTDSTVLKSAPDYVRQFSTSPISNRDMSIIL
ncbi:hypothetical protein L3Q82_012445, partial [Scortum barcoo]